MTAGLPDALVAALRTSVDRTADVLLSMDEPARRALMPALAERLKAQNGGWPNLHKVQCLLVAGMACAPTSAQAASWLRHREFRWLRWGLEEDIAGQIARVLRERDVPWTADLAARCVAALRPGRESWWSWRITAELVRAAGGAAVPTSDAFVLGWVRDSIGDRDRTLYERWRDDPFFDTLAPRLFEVDGVGAVLASFVWRPGPDFYRKDTYVGVQALLAMMEDGRVTRGTLLDGCLSRLNRGERAASERAFVQLHEGLATTLEERAARVDGYLRLLWSQTPVVVRLALDVLRGVDDADPLPVDVLVDASTAVLGRAEKGILRVQLAWLDRCVRRRPADAEQLVATVGAAFTHASLDVAERAVALVEANADRLGTATRAALAAAGAAIGGDLAARLRTVVGSVPGADPETTSTAVPLGPVVPLPAAAIPSPIDSPAELAAEVARLMTWTDDDIAITHERVLDGLVRMAATDPTGLRECLGPVFEPYRGHLHFYRRSYYLYDHFLHLLAAALNVPNVGSRAQRMLGRIAGRIPQLTSIGYDAAGGPLRLLLSRHDEATVYLTASPVPGLLATPTRATGHVDAATLVGRMVAYEAAGAEVWPRDLVQALLRLPPEVDGDALARAGRLVSPGGKRIADVLAAGGIRPDVTSRRVDVARPRRWLDGLRPAVGIAATGTAATDDAIERALFVVDPARDVEGDGFHLWPSVMPSHREVVAAHALPVLFSTLQSDSRGGGRFALRLAECSGPVGPAVMVALAYGLGSRHVEDRVAAVDALLHLATTEALDPGPLGDEIAGLSDRGILKLTRVVTALGDAAAAGAGPQVGEIAMSAVPRLLATGKPIAGLPDLVELATRNLPPGASREVPEVAAVAARTGSTRLITEARRLHRALTGVGAGSRAGSPVG